MARKKKIGTGTIVVGAIAGIATIGLIWWGLGQPGLSLKEPYYSWVEAAQSRKEIPREYKCGDPPTKVGEVICF